MEIQLGIDIHMIVYKKQGNITDEEIGQFNLDFLELVVSRGWLAGGGMKPVDINGEE